MPSRLKVAAAVLNQTPLDWDGNRERIRSAIREAKSRGVAILCLPEMCIPGYGCDDMFHAPFTHRLSREVLLELLPETEGLVVSFGLPIYAQKAVYNTACLVVDGRILGFTAKKALASDGIHYEPRWFKAWPEHQTTEIDFDGHTYPLGDLLYEVDGVRIGFEICEDAWVARRPGSDLSSLGVDIILNPSASHFAFGKSRVRDRFVVEGSRAFSTAYVYSNLLGNSSGRAIYDGEAMIASGGELLARGPRFSFRDVLLTDAVIDVQTNRMRQSQQGGFRPDFTGEGATIIKDDRSSAPYRLPVANLEPLPNDVPNRLGDAYGKEEEFTRVIALGLCDYLRKSRSHGFVVSLSGGADSTAVACLVSLMVDLAEAELGWERLTEKLSHLWFLDRVQNADDLKRELLWTVYQATRNSSETTRHAAETIATRAGATHRELNVDPVIETYKNLISEAMGRPLTWDRDDITLQNIQARGRAPSVWMFANIRGALLLSTSNRSEAAVGYATMDGDTSGGLSPIAGIDKAFLRRWLLWLQNTGPEGLQNWPEIEVVTKLPPTAELRPSEEEQTDEGDLMPYDLLDAIERAAIRDKRSPEEVLELMSVRFDYDREQLLLWIDRFFKLWCRNQWKRERYAPSFHVDDENLDPKTWCRFPILNGGYDRELREMRGEDGDRG